MRGVTENNIQLETKKMKRIYTMSVVAALLGLAATQASANLIVNGSFEDPVAFGSGQWNLYYTSIPGWTPVTSVPIEIGNGDVYSVTGYIGHNVMELDSTANVKVDQIFGSLGGSYTLSFLYARRGGIDAASCTFDVLWNGNLVTGFSPTVSPTSTAMTLFTTTVIGAAVNTLEFRGTGTQDQLGALVDDVQLVAVPEPTTVIAGALVLVPFAASTLRMVRRRKA
jgi:hypothetical protein